MKSYATHKPAIIDAVGNGQFYYRYGFQEVDAPAMEGENTAKQWRYEEVIVDYPLSSNAITKVVIADRWGSDHEAKLLNEFNAASMGLYDDETKAAKIQAYRTFLEERAALKSQIDADWEQYVTTQ